LLCWKLPWLTAAVKPHCCIMSINVHTGQKPYKAQGCNIHLLKIHNKPHRVPGVKAIKAFLSLKSSYENLRQQLQNAILSMRNSFNSINHLTPNGYFSGRTAPLTSRRCIFLFIQQIYVLNILNKLHTLRFFLFKMPFIS
jgi:hypothetical protein